jgi:hypothetical protein
MIERLRALPFLLRYTLYVAGALLLFLLAVGVGAGVAFVVDQQLVTTSTGSARNGTLEGSGLETTGPVDDSEDSAIEPSGDSADSDGTASEASFVHKATDENSRGDYTYISDPSIDGDPNAVVLASPTSGRTSGGATSYGHNIGVWYDAAARRWAIFNQDRTAVPEDADFKVVVPRTSQSFVHHAELSNTAGHYTYVDNRLTNGRPDAVLSVTQDWNPGGGRGVYNNHPIGTQYDAALRQWAVYNRDGAPMPQGAAFNIAVSAGTDVSAQ